MDPLLLCTDLDRTLLPNGPQPESPGAREAFRQFVSQAEVTLVFATGRDRDLVRTALEEYDLPAPDFVIGDVGASIHRLDGGWRPVTAWQKHIGVDWVDQTWRELAETLQPIAALRQQEPEKQNTYKLSYYAPLDANQAAISEQAIGLLRDSGVSASLTWSVDEAAQTGLLDILPQRASKLHALEYLQQLVGIDNTGTVFAGDSGNDLPVLTSPVPSVLVANASPEIAQIAMAMAREQGTSARLYLAKGEFLGMNGNYAAGILEGVAHYHPDLAARMQPAAFKGTR